MTACIIILILVGMMMVYAGVKSKNRLIAFTISGLVMLAGIIILFLMFILIPCI